MPKTIHPYDGLVSAHCKLALLTDFLASSKAEISEVGLNGLYWVISDAVEAMEKALEHYAGKGS